MSGFKHVSEEQREQLQSRTLKVVVASQVLGGAGLAAGITVGALLAQDMLGRDDLAGLPTALFTLGSALAAYLVGQLIQRKGRRPGLGIGFAVGGLGAFAVVLAAVLNSPVLLFAALFTYGAGTATNLQARYAGTDLAAPARRGMATSVALVSTTIGAVAGPNLVEPLGQLAVNLGLPALSGPFLLAGVAYLAAGAVLLMLLRPDPFLVAKQLSGSQAVSAADGPAPKPLPGAYIGGAVMVLTQLVMVAVMTMTPVHMRAYGHERGAIGLAIGWRVPRRPAQDGSCCGNHAASGRRHWCARAGRQPDPADHRADLARCRLELRTDRRHFNGRRRYRTREPGADPGSDRCVHRAVRSCRWRALRSGDGRLELRGTVIRQRRPVVRGHRLAVAAPTDPNPSGNELRPPLCLTTKCRIPIKMAGKPSASGQSERAAT